MYPKVYLDSFRTFQRTEDLFVAMPFAEAVAERWTRVFAPAAERVGLRPYRVDVRLVSDSILTDILAGIASSRLLLFDVSFVPSEAYPPAPNPNVMYELGIAHAVRLPEEVVVVRDMQSGDPAPFDIAHIRYTPLELRDVSYAQERLTELLASALMQIDNVHDMLVARTLQSLDIDESYFFGTVGSLESFDLYPFDPDRKGLYSLPQRDSSEGELRSIARRLIRLGLIQPGDPGPPKRRWYGATPEYLVTDLGRAVWAMLPPWCKPDD